MMQRLFVGVALPEPIRQQLTRLAPPTSAKVRPVKPDNLHLTLQFIGQAQTDAVAPALETVRARPFQLQFGELGKFGTPRKRGALWIGIVSETGLTTLAEQVAVALAAAGIQREDRAFIPHITLARFRRGARVEQLDRFVRQPLPDLPPLRVDRFHLYSSAQTKDGAVYTVEQSYPLQPAP